MPNDLFSYFSNQALGISNQETPEQKESLRELNRTLSYGLNDYQAAQESRELAKIETLM